jgi:hypothetical protein
MRTRHSSMMDATGARPDDLAQALHHLLEAMVPEPGQRLPLALAPAGRLLAAQSQLGSSVASQAGQAWQMAAALPALAFDVDGVQQVMALGGAAAQQWARVQAQWLEDATKLGRDMSDVRRANTVAKYVDHELTLVHQGLALVTGLATAAMQLMENTQINAAWLLSQRVAGTSSSTVAASSMPVIDQEAGDGGQELVSPAPATSGRSARRRRGQALDNRSTA